VENRDCRPGRRAALLLALLLALPGADTCEPREPPARPHPCWREPPGGPLIGFGDGLPMVFWNDPSVRRDGDRYRMWLSGGDLRQDPDALAVAIYEATSPDGVAWTLDPEPRLRPAGGRAWDSLRTETPEVLRVGDTYHLYYSGCTGTCETGVYAIGHATSSDGVHFRRDPANPVIRGHDDTSRWGHSTAAEPAAVVRPSDGRILLYFVGIRSHADTGRTEFGILAAVSDDGSRFRVVVDEDGEPLPVVRLAAEDPPEWAGVSHPGTFADPSGRIHLFHSVVTHASPFRTVRIDHRVSDDGLAFREVERGVVVRRRWHDHMVHAPSPLLEGGGLRLYFAGFIDLSRPRFRAGIGLAVRRPECP